MDINTYPLRFSPLYTDLYQLAMGQTYFLDGTADKPAVFDYFSAPFPLVVAM